MILARSGSRPEAPLHRAGVKPAGIPAIPAGRSGSTFSGRRCFTPPSSISTSPAGSSMWRLAASAALTAKYGAGASEATAGAWRLSSSEPKMCSIGTISHSAFTPRERRPGFGEVRSALLRLEQSNSGIAASERTADLALKLVDCLDGIPTGRPEERLQCARRLVRSALHGISESGVRIIGRLGLDDADIGVDGGEPAIAMGLARNLRARHAELRGRSGCHGGSQLRKRLRHRRKSIIERRPRWDRPAIANSPARPLLGANTGKNRCARPSLLTSVPSDSANVPAGRSRSAFAVVWFAR